MRVKFKKLNATAVAPKYAKPGDAALDLTATSKEYDSDTGNLVFGTGLAAEIPEGYVGLLFPRSSVVKTGLILGNGVGVLDSSFRGEIKAVFNTGARPVRNYEVGDRVAQLIILPFPKVEPEMVDELSTTERGTGSFGSTGV